MATKELWDRLDHLLKCHPGPEELKLAMEILLSMRPKEGPEAEGKSLPPFPDGCPDFRRKGNDYMFNLADRLGPWYEVSYLVGLDRRHCANAAIVWFLRETLSGVLDGNDYEAARAWYRWREEGV